MHRGFRATALRVLFGLALLSPLGPTAAPALDISGIELLWLHDRENGGPVVAWGLEAVVTVDDASGLGSIRLVTPTGTFGMASVGGGEYEASGFYANSTDLFAAWPGTGSYTFEFLNGTGGVIDSYSIALGPGDINEVTGYLDVTSPAHLGTLPIGSPLDWICVTCDGTEVALDAVDLGSDVEVDRYTGPAASGSWTPSGLVAGRSYETEAILSDYFDNDAALETTTALDSFQALVGYESINLIEWTATAAVPEPGTGVMMGLGCAGLGVFGRSRRRSETTR